MNTYAGPLPLTEVTALISLSLHLIAIPAVLNTPRTKSNSSEVTGALQETPLAPCDNISGVLGITRITLQSKPIAFLIESIDTPAATLTSTLSFLTAPLISSRTEKIICGFTAKNM